MKPLFTFLFIYLCVCNLSAQNLSGQVGERDNANSKQPLAGANVFWSDGSAGTATDTNGRFSIDPPAQYPAQLIISFVGFETDTLHLEKAPGNNLQIQLAPSTLGTVQVEAKVRTTGMDAMEIFHVENISKDELLKAACCNLSESFETNASIDAALTDALSGARKIRLLGLDGIYSQLMLENIPNIRGLAAVEGLDHIPGPWVESMQVTKGTGSVVNGFEAITGQINIELLKPDDVELDRYFFNVYLNRMGRLETNVHTVQKVGKRWSTLFFGHISDLSIENDHNNDGFLDMPLRRSYNVFNRWKYFGNRIRAQIGLRAIHHDIQSGQTGFNYDRDFGETVRYGLGSTHQQVDLFTKTGILFPNNPNASIGVMTNVRYHTLESYMGLRTYDATEKYGYLNVIHQQALGDTRHLLKLGASYMYSGIDQTFQDSIFNRAESIPGVFGEYTYTGGVSSLVIGNRFDFHNLYGLYIVPRIHYKYQLAEGTSIRLSVGRGIRTANPYNENLSVLASSRIIRTLEDLEPEKAWNGGITFNHEFKLGTKEAFLTLDYFRTEFENQVVVDMENPRYLLFYNLDGPSFSNSFQVETGLEIVRGLDFKTAYKLYDVQTQFLDGLKARPLVPRHRALANLAYATRGDKWKFDITANWVGPQRVPSTAQNSEPNQRPGQSEGYTLLNAQITKKFRKWEVYSGAENITGVRQDNPILAANDPFSTEFDASLVWAPINRQIIYLGLRVHL